MKSSTQKPVIIIPQAAPNFFTPNGTLRINPVKPSSKNAQELHDLHRSMNEVAVKIGLDSLIEERSRSQPCPPFRIMPMVVSNNCATIPSVVNMLENVSAQALVNNHSVGLSS
jgi:hypothetical protein